MLVVMGADGDDQSVDEMRRPAHDVDVTVGNGIEAAGIKSYAQDGDSNCAKVLAARALLAA
jgi:hypothetical protein